MRGLVAVQSLVRCYLARRQLKKLKIEAKSIEHQKKLNKGLENKIISLQHKLNEMVSPGSRQGGRGAASPGVCSELRSSPRLCLWLASTSTLKKYPLHESVTPNFCAHKSVTAASHGCLCQPQAVSLH